MDSQVRILSEGNCAIELIKDHPVQVNPENRLGSGPAGCKEIMSHEWFSSLNWSSIDSRAQEAPMLPEPEFDTDKLSFAPFQAERPKAIQTRKDIFAEEWEDLWEWVGDRSNSGPQ